MQTTHAPTPTHTAPGTPPGPLVRPFPGPVTTRDADADVGVAHNYASVYVPAHRVIVKGECNNPNRKHRNAMLTVFDVSTGRVAGTRAPAAALTASQSHYQ